MIAVDRTFHQKSLHLIVGCEDGVVRIYEIPNTTPGQLKLISSLETKGGPIQCMVIHDVTKFYSNDIVVGDSQGTLTVFCNEQILNRRSLSNHSIDCLLIEQDGTGLVSMVTSDSDGSVCAVRPYSDLWRLRFRDSSNSEIQRNLSSNNSVQALLSCEFINSGGHVTNYILASDSCCNLHFLQQGSLVLTLRTPTVITAMSRGFFVSLEDDQEFSVTNGNKVMKRPSQVALGGQNGVIYILSNYQVYTDEYSNVHLPITQLYTLPTDLEKDVLLCGGHFDALCAIHDGKELCRHKTPDWIASITTADIDNDGQDEVVIGCLDNSIQALKLNINV